MSVQCVNHGMELTLNASLWTYEIPVAVDDLS
jgi:hypothetical protein